jgi:peroxiredoxin
MAKTPPLAPEWRVSQWFNTPQPLTLAGLRGRVVALHTFQMLCPGCVAHGLPQAQRLHALFAEKDVAVVGLHTVFEHHAAMTPVSLQAFIHEYRLAFPIGVDEPSDDANGIPHTMRLYGFRGTPSLVVIDREGRVRHHGFGVEDDLSIGALIGRLLG